MGDGFKTYDIATSHSYYDEKEKQTYLVLTELCSDSAKERIKSVSINNEDGGHKTKTIN